MAFTDWGKLEELLNSIVNSLYSGDNLDEFILMKNTIAEGVRNSLIKSVGIAPITNEATAKSFIKNVKSASKLMQFPFGSHRFPFRRFMPAL
jgi:hypothetical protein